MKNIVFRNTDRYAIKQLLKEIGAHLLSIECENRKLSFPKRISLFYLEANEFQTILKYKYPSAGVASIIVVDRNDLPEKGWERVELI
ncbi:hypothetical protein [Croceivirga thetidis]|uniref:Uncharacterized protein n=1 Tax=Croceivirga thetidis TaxID=2721623 RepID=A0ABX1GMX6_9FLAO|nr:hypothetical protein [Croceivirga thetidis]NKI31258.1 hypothetical protein [Croceivirga thetidis]